MLNLSPFECVVGAGLGAVVPEPDGAAVLMFVGGGLGFVGGNVVSGGGNHVSVEGCSFSRRRKKGVDEEDESSERVREAANSSARESV